MKKKIKKVKKVKKDFEDEDYNLDGSEVNKSFTKVADQPDLIIFKSNFSGELYNIAIDLDGIYLRKIPIVPNLNY